MTKYVKVTDNPNMGRPEIEIDWKEFDKLCAMHATLEEISGWFDCSEDTIENKVKEKYDETFSEVLKKKSAKGKISLRRNQYQLSKTNPAMAIFMGKQYLGQRDVQSIDANINNINITNDWGDKQKEDLCQDET